MNQQRRFRKVWTILSIGFVLATVLLSVGVQAVGYDTLAAVTYADTWWNSRNPAYHDYSSEGGDCANYVSQCLIAGGLNLTIYPHTDAYTHTCIINCDYLNDYLVNYLGAQHETWSRSRVNSEREPLWFVKGDVAIFGSNSDHYMHSVFDVAGDASHYSGCDAHSYDQYHRSIPWFFQHDSRFDVVTFYHISNGSVSPPSPPAHVSPANGSTIDTLTPTFIWNSVSNADYYALYISEPPYGENHLVFNSRDDYGPIYGTSFHLPTGKLVRGVTYYWNMQAYNSGGGWGDFSSSWRFTTANSQITPQVSVSPGSGPAGTQFYARYTGFTHNSTLTSHLQKPDGSEFGTLPLNTDSEGNYVDNPKNITSDTFAPGTYNLWGVDNTTGISSAHTSFVITCTYSISPTSGSVSASGGSGSISVTTGSGCSWSASESCSWVTISPTSGTGNGTVTWNAQANTTCSSRTCTINVGGKTFTLTQAAGSGTCTISPTSGSVSASGGSGSISVMTGSGCSWSASESCSWVTISPTSGTGNGTVTWNAQANAGSARTCTITVCEDSFTLSQAGPQCPACTPDNPSPANNATNVSTSTTLQWECSGGNGADSYDVYFGTSLTPPLKQNVTSTNYNPGTLQSSTDYYWKVVAKKSGCDDVSGPEWHFKTGGSCGPETVTASDATVGCDGGTGDTTVSVGPLPKGFGGATITLKLDPQGCVKFTNTVTLDPDLAAHSVLGQLVASSDYQITYGVIDLNNYINVSTEDVKLFAVELTCSGCNCDEEIQVSVESMEDSSGNELNPCSENGTVSCGGCPAEPFQAALGQSVTGPSQDLDGDGDCEDINGDGRVGYGDTILLWGNFYLDGPAKAHPERYDFACNGNPLGFQDVIKHFQCEVLGVGCTDCTRGTVVPRVRNGGSTVSATDVELPCDGSTGTTTVGIDTLPSGVGGVTVTLALDPQGCAKFTKTVTLDPDLKAHSVLGQLVSSSDYQITYGLIDLTDYIQNGATNVELFDVGVVCEGCNCSSAINVTVESMEDSGGNLVTPLTVNGTVTCGTCTYTISPTSQSFDPSGGTGSFTVTTSRSDCQWTAQKDAAWITITSGGSGLGSKTLHYQVATNTGNQRTGHITVEGQSYTINQGGALQFVVDPSSCSVSVPEGGTETFQVKLSAQPSSTVQASVSLVSGDSDISVTGGSSLSFTTSNWNSYQTVTLAAAEDADTTNGTATIRIHRTSGDSVPDKDVTSTEQDNDQISGCWSEGSVQIQAQGSSTDSQNWFGVDPSGTDCSDSLDIPEPPTSPAPYTALWFVLDPSCSNTAKYTKDIKASIACNETKTWTMRVADEGDTQQVTLSWDLQQLPTGGCSGQLPQVTLLDTVTGTVTNMRATSSYSYTKQSNPETREFAITVGCGCPEVCTDLTSAGWHMMTLPGDLCETCPDLLTALSDDIDPCYIFHYDSEAGGYVMAPPAENINYQAGMGFWVRTYEDPTHVCADVKLKTEKTCIPLQAGWNQIGNPFNFAVALSNVTVKYQGNEASLDQAQQNGWVSKYLFAYDTANGGYGMLDPANGQLEPWAGYWMRAYVDCEVCISPIPAPPAPPSALLQPQAFGLGGIPMPPSPPNFTKQVNEDVVSQLTVLNVPNPIRSQHTTTFKVEGKGSELVQAIRVEIYDQSGQKVFTQDINAKELSWHTNNDTGELLANGVYLYQVWVKVANTWYPTGVHKLAVIR